jgi:hypothetical protein
VPDGTLVGMNQQPAQAGRRVWYVTAVVEASAEDADMVAEAIARALCPDPDHEGPCPVPWTIMCSEVEEPDRSRWLAGFDEERPPRH